ncbi:methionine-R-sulfoxide reductase B1-like isoform X2 [Phymastichus coffea]|uniref:methionine-R-sulfoxide reductase B1-like isoform X2 n=1 Tax=Phymastichus coffea TaxID=108790 RepID=UPI00273C2399|nr:methionine-R-sulfoxide reductase B1-like isoform X2 [Phymastichus coffea]
MEVKICKNDLKIRLTPIQWFVTQEKGTERPFSGCYNKFNGKGIYVCIVCGQELFSSKNKFDSGCGWPAFNEVLDQGRIVLKKDTSLGGKYICLTFLNTSLSAINPEANQAYYSMFLQRLTD